MPCSIPSPPPRSRTPLHVHNAHPDYNSNQEADLLSKVECPSKSRMHQDTEHPLKSVLVHPQLNGGQGEIQNYLVRYPTKRGTDIEKCSFLQRTAAGWEYLPMYLRRAA